MEQSNIRIVNAVGDIVDLDGLQVDIGILTDYQKLRKSLVLSLIPAKGNEELLESVPHRKLEDLAITYRVLLQQDVYALVNNRMLKRYGITAEELHADALQSAQRIAPALIRPMQEMLPFREPQLWPCGPALYVATTDIISYGASVIVYPGLLDRAAAIIGEELFIIPSSIHEVILMEAQDPDDYEAYEEMVQAVNRAEVAPRDRLSDRVYHYDSRTHVFELAEKYAGRNLHPAA